MTDFITCKKCRYKFSPETVRIIIGGKLKRYTPSKKRAVCPQCKKDDTSQVRNCGGGKSGQVPRQMSGGAKTR